MFSNASNLNMHDGLCEGKKTQTQAKYPALYVEVCWPKEFPFAKLILRIENFLS